MPKSVRLVSSSVTSLCSQASALTELKETTFKMALMQLITLVAFSVAMLSVQPADSILEGSNTDFLGAGEFVCPFSNRIAVFQLSRALM